MLPTMLRVFALLTLLGSLMTGVGVGLSWDELGADEVNVVFPTLVLVLLASSTRGCCSPRPIGSTCATIHGVGSERGRLDCPHCRYDFRTI